jgi:phosphate:Na+ symporter
MTFIGAIVEITGGLVFFVFGLQTVNRAVDRLSGAHLKVALHLLTRNRVTGILVGVVFSFLLSSTSAATVLLVGMGDAGLLTLRQALAVVLGAAIGTSLTVQIIAFDVGAWAVYIIIAGFALRTFARRRHWRYAGGAVFGIGLVFFGLAMMKAAAHPTMLALGLGASRSLLAGITVNPFYIFLIGVGATAILQSSAVTLALAFATGASVAEAIPLALGASIGTCAAGIISGIAARPVGRQIALGHFIMKLLGASFFMLILVPFTNTVEIYGARLGIVSQQRVIAHANTLYNCLNALIFLPIIPLIERVVLLIAGRARLPAALSGFSISDLEDPPGAVAKARAQTVNMGRAALLMLRKDLSAFLVDAGKVADDIVAAGRSLDMYDTVLSDFLRRIDEGRLGSADNQMRNRLLYVIRDVGYIGAVVTRELAPLASRKSRKGLDFSIEGSQQFEAFHRLVADDFAEAIDLLEGLPASPERVLANSARVEALRQSLAQAHIHRVSQGVTADVETSRILLDAVAALRVIHYYVCDMVELLHPGARAAAL